MAAPDQKYFDLKNTRSLEINNAAKTETRNIDMPTLLLKPTPTMIPK